MMIDHQDLHSCAVPGCPNQCRRAYLMCFRHWALVPRHTKAAVMATYDPDGTPTREYVSAVRAAIEAVQAALNPPKETPAPAPAPTPQPIKHPLSVECVAAATRAARVLVSEGLISEARVKERLWESIKAEMLRDFGGDFTHDQVTLETIQAAALDLRKQLIENNDARARLIEAEDRAASTGRAHAQCRSCGQPIRWEKHPHTNKPHPVNLDSTSHFSTCPQAKNWRAKK